MFNRRVRQTADLIGLGLSLVYTSELNFHIWNVNCQSFARAKVKPRWPPKEGNFGSQFQSSSRPCTSVPVLCTILIFSFCLVRLRKTSQPWKKCLYEILLDQFDIIEYLKGFIIAVWPKKCTKLSEDGKLTVKKGLALSSFSKKLFETVLSGFSYVWQFIFVKIYNL